MARKPSGELPFAEFFEGETDVSVRAKILTKIEHGSRFRPEQLRRPLADTLEGRVKELRFGQIRILFSLEVEDGLWLLLGGERKKADDVSPSLIREAAGLRERWVASRDGKELDISALKKRISRKSIRWP